MRVVFVSIPASDAESMLLILLRERLVAGGSIFPMVHTRYWWNGEIVAEQEAMLMMETAADRVEPMMARIRELHPYDTPKVIILTPQERTTALYRWVHTETR